MSQKFTSQSLRLDDFTEKHQIAEGRPEETASIASHSYAIVMVGCQTHVCFDASSTPS